MPSEEMISDDLSGEELLAKGLEAFNNGEEFEYEEPEKTEYQDIVDSEEPKKRGHMTREEWESSGKDPEDYLTEEEYNRVGEMRDDKSITRQNLAKTNVQLQKAIQDLMSTNEQRFREIEEKARRDERDKLIAQQKEAIDYGNTDEALSLEKKIIQLDNPKPQPQQKTVSPDVVEWHSQNNDWYGVSSAATEMMDVLMARASRDGTLARCEAQGLSFSDAVAPIVDKVKHNFPHLFDIKPQPKPQPRPMQATERSIKPKSEKRYTLNDIHESQRQYARVGMKATNMTEHEYVKAMLENQ